MSEIDDIKRRAGINEVDEIGSNFSQVSEDEFFEILARFSPVTSSYNGGSLIKFLDSSKTMIAMYGDRTFSVASHLRR